MPGPETALRRVLWVCNTQLPGVARMIGGAPTPFGGWMASLHDRLLLAHPELEFTVISPQAGGSWRKVEDGRTTHLLLPMKDLKRNIPVDSNWWRNIPHAGAPDLIHVHGTEYAFALPLVRDATSPVAVSVQGSVSRYGGAYLAGISPRALRRNSTLRSVVLRDSVLKQRDEFLTRGIHGEQPLLRAADVVIGRTDFDRELAADLAPSSTYEVCHEMLRPQFTARQWLPTGNHRRRLYISQASYPIKGFHQALLAIPRLVAEYPELEVVVAGSPPYPQGAGFSRLKTSDYGRYVKRLITALGVSNNVRFTGVLSVDRVLAEMLKADVFWLPSAMENSSNSLAEAMMLGMPVVAAATGGTPSMIENNRTGLLYDYENVNDAASKVSRLLGDSRSSQALGRAARLVAVERHDPDTIVERQTEIYRGMLRRA